MRQRGGADQLQQQGQISNLNYCKSCLDTRVHYTLRHIDSCLPDEIQMHQFFGSTSKNEFFRDDEVVRFHGKHKISDDLNQNPEIHRSIGAILPCYDDGAKRGQGTT